MNSFFKSRDLSFPQPQTGRFREVKMCWDFETLTLSAVWRLERTRVVHARTSASGHLLIQEFQTNIIFKNMYNNVEKIWKHRLKKSSFQMLHFIFMNVRWRLGKKKQEE